MASQKAKGPRRVQPQPMTEKTYMENVVGFINNVVPKSVVESVSPQPKAKAPVSEQTVTWVHFDESGVSDSREPGDSLPMLLIGYPDGMQVWHLRSAKDIVEVYSTRSGAVRWAKILTDPSTTDDQFANLRPVLAYREDGSQETVTLMSLKTLESVPNGIKMKTKSPLALHSSSRCVAVTSADKIELFNPATMQHIFTVTKCFRSPGPVLNPIALSPRWLAYATSEPCPGIGCGGINPDITGPVSSMAAVVGLAQKTGSGLMYLGGKGVKKVSDMINGPTPHASSKKKASAVTESDKIAGTVKIIDVLNPTHIISHFRAHYHKPVASLMFDPSGSILITADTEGQDFNVYQLCSEAYPTMPHRPTASNSESNHSSWFLTARHIYTLNRGVTTAVISDISFSPDSRWVSITSERGSSHIYGINPRGGPVDARTHTSATVTNPSRFHTSAGISEVPQWGGHGTIILFGAKTTIKYPVVSDPRARTRSLAPLTATCFGSLVSSAPDYPELNSLESSSSHSKVLLTFLVCTSTGQLVEHKIKPFGPESSLEIESHSVADTQGGVPVGDEHSIATGMFRVLEGVKGMVTGKQAGRTTEEPRSPNLLVGSEFGLACAAIRGWNLRRHTTWAPYTHHTSKDHLKVAAPTDRLSPSSVASDETTWLSNVEINCYTAPHRRLWMGPQFTFKTFQPQAGTDGSAVVPVTQSEGGYLEERSLTAQAIEGHRSQPMAATHPKGVKIVDVQVAGSPWPDAPISVAANEDNVLHDIESAIADNWDAGWESAASSRNSRSESVTSELMFALETDDGHDMDDMGGSMTPTTLSPQLTRSPIVDRSQTFDLTEELAGAMDDGKDSPLFSVDQMPAVPTISDRASESASTSGSEMSSRPLSSRSSSSSSEPFAGSESPVSSNSSSGLNISGSRKNGRSASSSSADKVENFPDFEASGSPTGWPSLSSAKSVPQRSGRKMFHVGTPPSDDAMDFVGSPGRLRRPVNGLNAVLGDADQDTPMHRVHSNVSLPALSDALSDDDDLAARADMLELDPTKKDR